MSDLITDGYIYSKKKPSYTSKHMVCIETTVKKLKTENLKTFERPLMLLGKIQSGKTKTFIGIMSLAFDNGYDLTVVLTKGTNALAEQTLQRMKQEFKELIDDDYVKVYDIMNMPDRLSKFELNQKMIIIVKKQHKNLPRLEDFISKYPFQASKKCLIIDDEADFASIGFEKKKDETIDIRKIAGAINKIRGSLEDCDFLQVTATPYSLYLQPEDISLPNVPEIKPIRPVHTIVVPEGEGYVGGDYYFLKSQENDNPARLLYQEVVPEELEILRKQDRRRFKPEEALTSKKINTLRKSIMNFIVGGCIRSLQDATILPNESKAKSNKYSFIIHTETNKNSHAWQEDIVISIIDCLQELKVNNKALFDVFVKESYEDLYQSVTEYKLGMPEFHVVRDKVYEAVENEYISITVVNSENDVKVLLDENGQLKLRTPLNVFVGGQILDRGITITNLIGFYYGRRPTTMQQDTVLQHSRMFGYRSKADLAVTRFYTTKNLHNALIKINEFDAALREELINGRSENGVVFIQRDEGGRVIPCSPNKIYISRTVTIKSHKRILPVGFSPKCKSSIEKIVIKIDNLVKQLQGDKDPKSEVTVSVSEAIRLITMIYSTMDIENEYTVNEEAFVACLKYLSKHETVKLIIRKGREMKKHDKANKLQNSPDTPKDELTLAKNVAMNEPALILLRQDGKKEDGWSGTPFWWPVLVVQKNSATSVYAHHLAG